MLKDFVQSQRPISHGQDHHAITANVLRVLGQVNAARRSACAGASNHTDAPVNVTGRDFSAAHHLLFGEGAVAAGAAEDANAIDAIIDLMV